MKVKLGQEETCDTRKNERSSADGEQPLCKTCRHKESEAYGSEPNTLQFLKQIKMGMGIPGNVFLDQGHAYVEAANSIGIVPRFNDAHQLLVHDKRG